MKKVERVTGKVVPYLEDDIDTDKIIPAQYLTSTSRSGFGEALFKRLREEPKFTLNLPIYSGGKVLLVGANFGCGSSREHAVWALQGAGFEAVMAPYFADIFQSNCGKNGLLAIDLTPEVFLILKEHSLLATGDLQIEIDLRREELIIGKDVIGKFKYDSFQRHCLLNGVDELGFLLEKVRGHSV
jgi:3-isopropylmalate/(R)-2-methylmalate dehydratase small subunit